MAGDSQHITITVRLIRSFEHRNVKHVVFKDIKLTQSAAQFMKYVLQGKILLRYNSLPCGADCCSRMATRHHGQRLRKIDIYSWP